MADFIGSIGAAYPRNWEICKRSGLWGVRRSRGNVEVAARQVARGDRLFIWQGGLLAVAEARSSANVPTALDVVPWPDASSYSYTIPIRVLESLPVPIKDSFPGWRKSSTFGVENIWITWGFASIPEAVARRMSSEFADSA